VHWGSIALLWLQLIPASAQAFELAAENAIEGVQPAALDQPRIYLNLRRDGNGPVLHTQTEERLSGVEAFLDTGASGVMLSKDTVQKLSVRTEKDGVFEDVGIAGTEKFAIAEPLFIALAPYPKSDPETADYSPPMGPIRAAVRPGGGLLDLVAPGLDVVGMPLIVGKVLVLDPKPLVDFEKIRTSVVSPDDPRIPKTTRHVPLTAVAFAQFTRVHPAGATSPTLGPNPMIGPDPFRPGDPRPLVRITHGGKALPARSCSTPGRPLRSSRASS
jgi:hypothetical protein